MKKPKPGLYAGILTLLVFAVCLTVPALMLRGRTQEPAAQEESPSPTEVLSLAERDVYKRQPGFSSTPQFTQ